MVQIRCCLTFVSVMFASFNNKIFSSELVIYFFEPCFFSGFFIQRSFSTIPKSMQRISVNKSPHIFKKSKERFLIAEPTKFHFITPFFSNSALLRFFLNSITNYFFYLSFSIQIKFVNKVTLLSK
jgi:hypothetical protein